MRPKEVSPYKLNTFLRCPKQYHFEYIDPQMALIKKQIKKKRPVLEMGSFIHDALTLFFKSPVEERTQVTISGILKDVWQGPRGEKYGFKSLEQERRCYQEALRMLKRFVENENLNPNIFALPVSPPGNSFDDYKKIPFADNLELGGKIDRVDITPEGTLEIIDYKTGQGRDDNLQLLVYAFLVEGLFKKKVSKASYLYLKSGSWRSIVPEKELFEQTRKQILEIVEKIAKETEWSPSVSKLCAYCDYLYFCPAKEEIKSFLGEEAGNPL